jgi:hypothetical protein
LSINKEADLEYALRGKTWTVYWYLLKKGQPVGVREIYHFLHLSSPSVALHHLEQLSELSLVQKQDIGGKYTLVSQVKIGLLKHYIKLGKLLFPRYFCYALFATLFYLSYFLFFFQTLALNSLLIISFGAVICAVFWYEAYRVWIMRPF